MQGQRWRRHGEGFNYGLSHVRFRGAREPQWSVSLKIAKDQLYLSIGHPAPGCHSHGRHARDDDARRRAVDHLELVPQPQQRVRHVLVSHGPGDVRLREPFGIELLGRHDDLGVLLRGEVVRGVDARVPVVVAVRLELAQQRLARRAE